MPLEFRCPQCQQQLRVPDDAAGKQAKCPKCGAIAAVPVPSGGTGAGDSPTNFPAANFPAATQPNYPAGAPNFPPPPVAGSPFGDAAQASGNPFAADYPAKPSLNPYASPTGGYAPATSGLPSLPVTNQRVEIGHIWNYAWQIWQTNLGLLVGVTLVILGVSYAVGIPIGILQVVLDQNDRHEAALIVAVLGQVVSYAIQTFLGIGQNGIAIKLARQQPATFGDLFAGGNRFLPVIGVMLLATMAMMFGFALCIVPGILLMLMFWPCYYLVLEGKTPVLESFSVAYLVTEGNRLTTFLLSLLSVAVMIVGVMALCIGLLFAFPLVAVLWATAYLMMSGQIAVPQLPPAMPDYYSQASKDAGQF